MLRFSQVRTQLSGVAPVGVGLTLIGLSAYAVLGLAGHALDPREYNAVASLYLLMAIVGPGIFIAVEQQANSTISGRIAAGRGTLPVVRSLVLVSSALAVAACAVLLALSPLLVDRVFGGSWALLVAALIAVVGAAAVYVLRGVFAGQRRYGWYSATLVGEGLGRLAPCAALLVLGTADAAGFGFAFACGAVLAAAATVVGVQPGGEGPAVALPALARGVALLACASGLTLLVANVAPIVVTSRLTDDPRTAAAFVSVFVLARIPLFLFAPVQAFLLPSLTAAVGRGDAEQVRVRTRTMVLAVGAVGVPGVVFAALLGPWAARVFFDAPVTVSMLVAGLLGVSTVAMMATQVLQPTLVALGEHRTTTGAWVAGTLVFAALLFAPVEPLRAAVAAQLVGPAIVVAIMAGSVRTALSRLRVRSATAV